MINKETAIRYAEDVLSSGITACHWVKLACKRWLNDLGNPDYYYNESEVDAVITFIQTLYLTEQTIKKHFILEDWQIFITVAIYSLYRVSNNTRKIRYAYLEMARKNGKSQWADALAIYHLLADVDAQVVVSANSKDQAKNVNFKKCKSFASQIDKKKKHIRHYYSSLKYKDSELIVTASDASKLDGLNTSFAIIDELHEAPNNLMYNVIKSSMGSREQPLFVCITTAGFDQQSFCYQLRTYCTDILSGIADDPSQFAIIFTLDDDDDYTNKDCWRKANPNLSISVYPDFIESEVNKATNFEAERNGVLVKNFNRWLKANSDEDWLSEDVVVASMQNITLSDPMFKEMPVWVGVDLSSVSDCTSVTYMIPVENQIYFFNEYYVPEDSVNTNINKDKFRNAAALGQMNVTSGNVCDYDRILADIQKVNMSHAVQMISYDKWNSTQFVINSTQFFIMQPYSQNAGSLNKPIKEFQRLILSGNIILQNNIITKWMISNAIIKTNSMGNQSIDKSSRSKKIDGVASMLNSLGAYLESPRYSFGVY
jgi:phage terminase large subunit-like protein